MVCMTESSLADRKTKPLAQVINKLLLELGLASVHSLAADAELRHSQEQREKFKNNLEGSNERPVMLTQCQAAIPCCCELYLSKFKTTIEKLIKKSINL